MIAKAKRCTLNDIAELSGVSKTTVSMVLNGRADEFRIKEETRQKILQIAEKNHYRANIYAKALQSQRTNTIGLVIPDFSNFGFAQTSQMLERLCRNHGLQLLISCSDEEPHLEAKAIENLLERQIDILITTPVCQKRKHYPYLNTIPTIQLDRFIADAPKIPYIITDDKSAVAAMVAQMISKYQLNEFYYLGGLLQLTPSEARLQGFKCGLQQAGLALQNNWVSHRDYHSESGYIMMQQLLQRLGRLPQAVFVASYGLLVGVLRFLNEHQLLDQLSSQRLHLATFDDYELLNCLPFKIHSIRQDHEKIANELFQAILSLLEQKPIANQIIPAHLCWRD
ncbi:LacI family DNA-binding transcriptional regulator [Testudinibacter sp. TR-2022]|uniref:substrate-binding domain-containing protein n=1 Tax=Testudinibacter sp. TR-2022 TaxID=2585029 RepID=UPI0011197D78|nr:LacI family DNA-binding transcriptional regulator [Testudinibacter sp. TR-2022]TNH02654.1 LacI family DNA-binding transcriptional regulator [Pasteurellaceae bacterium Phil31]TNH09292.1 LacI family DNA-binding transcriptional regulator [Testudinibacter sp. TR-2022]TNH10043.1 LacI family DNA-binding transcriptional regulator [Testudinibacter sp. TR-2022]TNH11652.1 LacI family DNA-binding transcriptional regulator [Testudinibacter sp. TR-2022]TNH20614.1 LacI family DNA-binding transcriptional 